MPIHIGGNLQPVRRQGNITSKFQMLTLYFPGLHDFSVNCGAILSGILRIKSGKHLSLFTVTDRIHASILA